MFLLLLSTLAPPVASRADLMEEKISQNWNSLLICYLFFGKDKAGDVSKIEEEVAHNVSCLSSGHLEAGAEPFVTGAVHDGVYSYVGQAILGLTWLNTDGTA